MSKRGERDRKKLNKRMRAAYYRAREKARAFVVKEGLHLWSHEGSAGEAERVMHEAGVRAAKRAKDGSRYRCR